MKKLMLIAASVLCFFSCEEPKIEDKPSQDSITVSPESKTFEKEGGSVSVAIVSSADWTLSPKSDYDWVEVSAMTGGSGDIVKFTVPENRTGEVRNAEFDFVSGEAVFTFKLDQKSGQFTYIEQPEVIDYTVLFDDSKFNITVKTNLAYDDLKVEVSQDAGWLKHNVNMPGTEQNTVTVIFNMEKNPDFGMRKGSFTLSGDDATPVTINVTQLPEPVLEVEQTMYNMDLAGGEVSVPVNSNVEYEIVVPDEAKSWIESKGKVENAETFTVSEATEKRSAKITLRQINVPEGQKEAVSAEFEISQRTSALINKAIDMTNARLYAKEWKNPDVLTDMSAFTLEALVCADDFNKGWQENSTIMGINQYFLISFGNAEGSSDEKNRLYILTPWGNLADKVFEPGKWYHIAATFDNGDIKIYADGEVIAEPYTYVTKCTFAVPGSEKNDPEGFYLGYAWHPNRDFHGTMSEVRIWNKALTQEELKAENHFYSVDPASEGLVAYWKLDDGDTNPGATVVKDYTANGNDLIGEIHVRKDGDRTIGDPGIQWKDVSLPEAK